MGGSCCTSSLSARVKKKNLIDDGASRNLREKLYACVCVCVTQSLDDEER